MQRSKAITPGANRSSVDAQIASCTQTNTTATLWDRIPFRAPDFAGVGSQKRCDRKAHRRTPPSASDIESDLGDRTDRDSKHRTAAIASQNCCVNQSFASSFAELKGARAENARSSLQRSSTIKLAADPKQNKSARGRPLALLSRQFNQ
jgi:hypothetical protein